MRPPNPTLFSSLLRPTSPPVRRGVAVSERDRWLIVRFRLAGLSCGQIARLPFVGRCENTVRAVWQRWLVDGTLKRRPTGGLANCPYILDAPALPHLKARLGEARRRPARALRRR